MTVYRGMFVFCPGCGSGDHLDVIGEDYYGLTCECGRCGCSFQTDVGDDGLEYYVMNDYRPMCPECGWRNCHRIGQGVFQCGRCGVLWRSKDDEAWFQDNSPYPEDDVYCIHNRNRRCSQCGNCGNR